MKNCSYISQSKGQSLIELSVALFLVSSVFLLAFPALRTAILVGKQTSAREELRGALEQTEAIIRHGFANSRSFYPIETIKIGEDGTSISFLHLDMGNLFKVTANSDAGNVTLCLQQQVAKLPPSPGLEKTSFPADWLGITPYGVVELKGRVRRRAQNKSCPNGAAFGGSLSPKEKASFNQLEKIEHAINPVYAALGDLSLLIPVDRNFDLLVDASNSLRFKSNLSPENQPIVHGVASLEVLQKRINEQTIMYEVIIEAENRLQKIQAAKLNFLRHNSKKTSFADVGVI